MFFLCDFLCGHPALFMLVPKITAAGEAAVCKDVCNNTECNILNSRESLNPPQTRLENQPSGRAGEKISIDGLAKM